jgi:hypothetical protein
MRPEPIRAGQLLIGLGALAGVTGCAPGSGPNFVRLVNDTGHTVQVREITQSNSPSCYQLGYTNHSSAILLSPNGECVLTAGELGPGQLVPLSLGTPADPATLAPIVVVNGDGKQRCMVLPFPVSRAYGARFAIYTIQPRGCD